MSVSKFETFLIFLSFLKWSIKWFNNSLGNLYNMLLSSILDIELCFTWSESDLY